MALVAASFLLGIASNPVGSDSHGPPHGFAVLRSQLEQTIADKNPHLTKVAVCRAVSTIFDAIIEQLVAGGRVELRGFGSFSTRARTARNGRNPSTGGVVAVAAKRALHFTQSKRLRALLNVRPAAGPPAYRRRAGGHRSANSRRL